MKKVVKIRFRIPILRLKKIKNPTAIKLGEGGGVVLNRLAIKKKYFFAASLRKDT